MVLPYSAPIAWERPKAERKMTYSKELQLEMLRRMVRIREFEMATMDVFKRGQIKGAATLYIGQEASAVGVCLALRQDDLITGTHRSHGHLLAKGAASDRVMAEVFGRETGYCKGRGGSIARGRARGWLPGSPRVVAAGMPIAVGIGLGFKLRGEKRVAVLSSAKVRPTPAISDESLQYAAPSGNLPVIFVLENNRYAVSTNVSESCSIQDLSQRAASYGIPGCRVDGFDVMAVYRATAEAVERARAEKVPPAIVTETYRFDGHYSGEPEVDPQPRRSQRMEEKRRYPAWFCKQPCSIMGSHLRRSWKSCKQTCSPKSRTPSPLRKPALSPTKPPKTTTFTLNSAVRHQLLFLYPWGMGPPEFPPRCPMTLMDLLDEAVHLGVGVVPDPE